MRRLFWVRHGPTHAKAFAGWRDIPADLSDSASLARVARHVPDTSVFVSSDLVRARATADALADGRARLPDRPGLREMNFGEWDGLHWQEVASRDPELSRNFWEEPGPHRAPGGESWNDLAERVRSETAALLAETSAPSLVIVSHMGTILAQLQFALNCAAAEALSHQIEPLSVTELQTDGTDWQVIGINHRP